MPTMYGIPMPGHPMESAALYSQPAKELIEREAGHKMAVESEMKHGDIPVNEPGLTSPVMMTKEQERLEAIKKLDEANNILDDTETDEDEQSARDLVKFWQDKIESLTKEIESEPKESKIVKQVEVPEIQSRIQVSAINRVKNPRNKRHKIEKKKVKRISYLI
jgi:cob(I)alamin adenosyltransferase